MKKRGAILLLSLALLSASCGIMKPRNAVVITDHEAIEAILMEHFPELYDLHEQGHVEVDAIYSYTGRNGQPEFKVSFRYIPAHNQ
ncbi:MAG: hypothetical protein K6G79_03675 [Bacteroidales bacterium]|nr:hypothetical protein [Bacteroidales bacterium]